MARHLKLGIAAILVLVVLFAWRRGSAINTWDIRNDPPASGSAIIVLGDSLSRMPRGVAERTWVDIVASQTGKDIQNEAVPGDTTLDALARIERDVLNRDPRVVLVLLGGNDFLRRRSISDIATSLREIITRIQDRGALVILVGIEAPSLVGSGAGAEELRAVARETGAVFIPDVLDGILTDPTLRLDAIHPNEKGHAIMAERILAVARPYLDR